MKFLRLTIFMARSMHYVSKYKILGKYLQPFTRYSTKEKPEVPKCQMLAANILNINNENFGTTSVCLAGWFEIFHCRPLPCRQFGFVT